MMLLRAQAREENGRGFKEELKKKKPGGVFIAHSWNNLFQNLRPTNTGRSTFNGHDDDRENRGHVATVSYENLRN